MPFLAQGNTNWKFIAIVAVLAVVVGGGILFLSGLGQEEPVIPEEEITEIKISMFIDSDSFDLEEKTFGGEPWPSGEKLKVLTTEDTKFYRTAGPARQKEYFTFTEFHSLLENWVGPPWPFTVKGAYKEEGILMADEVFYILQ